jgi:hypothetical protein
VRSILLGVLHDPSQRGGAGVKKNPLNGSLRRCSRVKGREIPPRFLQATRRADLLREQARLRGLRAQAQVLPERSARKIARSVHEAAPDNAPAIARTEAYAVSRRQRKKVELLFAHLKRILRLDRLPARPARSKDEFLLAATTQNLRKLAKLISLPAPVFAT